MSAMDALLVKEGLWKVADALVRIAIAMEEKNAIISRLGRGTGGL